MSTDSESEVTIQKIRQHSRQLVREMDVLRGFYLDSGYTFSQMHILFELSTHGSLPLMQLADNLLADKSNVSRTVKKLTELELIKVEKGELDSRQKFFSLTEAGKKALDITIQLANEQVATSIRHLSTEQQETVIEGLRLYSTALRKSRLQKPYAIRPIKKTDNSQIAQIIRDVMTEFNAVGQGYSIGDPEVDDMHGNYSEKGFGYFVVTTKDDRVVGGGGIAPLVGGKKTTCELRKMFFLPEVRGIGIGRRLLEILMAEAKKHGYTECYLETLDRMGRANELYKRSGFKERKAPMGNTGHCSCDRYYARTLG